MPSHRPEHNDEPQHEHGTAQRGVIDAIERNESLPGGIAAEDALGIVMCVLERALAREDARQLERALPESIRKLVTRCADHVADASSPPPRSAGEFLRDVGQHLELTRSEAEELTAVVFRAVHGLMSVGEVLEVARELPEPLRELWTAGDDRGDPVQSSRNDG